ncbi:helix-turn-helix transcriptional regulator [Formosa haliotis]|uniref:helix-turn-helix transcriptional regulator n=1 Tax=Formosa haliotis TaxID=1555194 RepID=UPI0008260DD1|nr:WYL domain-containing protein [Formosa haliotis]
MSNPSLSKRTLHLLTFIRNKHYPTKAEVLEYLKDQDISVSERTIERELKSLRNDFGIEISHCRKNRGYYINEEESVDLVSFFKYLELVSISEIFSEGLMSDNKLKEYILFENTPVLNGIENLAPILIAIKQGCKLSFEHYNYYKDTKKQYTISPLMIKEYLNRWYVIGVVDDLNTIRIFGIDRLSDLKQGDLQSVNRKDFEEDLNKFSCIVGVRVNDASLENIVLKTHKKHMHYLESLPLHPSQHIKEDDEPGYYKVSYHIIPNYEFDIQILKMSMEVEVISPPSYRNHIKKEIEKIYNKYQD